MLKSRPSKPFWVALSSDTALDSIDNRTLEDYFRRRDISILPIDIDKGVVTITGESVTLFKVRPLNVKGERVLDELGKGAKDMIIGSHVVAVKNHSGCKVKIDKDGNPELSVESLGDEGIDGATRDELFQIIIESGRGADGDERGFTSPDGWRQRKMISALLPAVRARIEAHQNADRLDSAGSQENDIVT